MRRFRVVAVVLVAICATATVLVAFCPNDQWGGLSSNIYPGQTWCKMNIVATSSISHLYNHFSCAKRFYARASLDDSSCMVTNNINHTFSGSNTVINAMKTYYATPTGSYTVDADHWTDDGNLIETHSSSGLVCPPLSQCNNPPPEGTCMEGYEWHTWWCECQPISPIILDLAGDGYDLTPAMGGVHFDLNNDGKAELISWTDGSSNDGFLALDRNGNQTIDDGSELFGNYSPANGPMSPNTSNGFEALATIEAEAARQLGVTPDGVIDSKDTTYAHLRVWVDANHNGVSEPAELRSLDAYGIASLDLNYRKSGRQDRFGNEFKLRAMSFVIDDRGKEKPRAYYDVFLRTP